ncbi:MAG: transcription-repair coupling factor [Alphaproteobacteria bacterium]|nr:transcription-repair coupling factor [Alphaproteobacteria bacterium]
MNKEKLSLISDFINEDIRYKAIIYNVPIAYDALVLSEVAKIKRKCFDAKAKQIEAAFDILHITTDDIRMARLADALSFYAPDIDVIEFPAWDTVPYDRVSPSSDVIGKRVDALVRIISKRKQEVNKRKPRVIITTVASALQRIPQEKVYLNTSFEIRSGKEMVVDEFIRYLERNGYNRTGQVMEHGEYAIRGGIIDVFPASMSEPLRLDMFGDEIDEVRTFDPLSQRASGVIDGAITLKPMSEIVLDQDTISRFRSMYREMFGNVSTSNDALYEAISEGQKYNGMEHWLPLFCDGMDTIFSYLSDALVTLDMQVEEAVSERFEQILEYYKERKAIAESKSLSIDGGVYNPVPPNMMFLDGEAEWNAILGGRKVIALSSYSAATMEENLAEAVFDAEAKPGRDFADVRANPTLNIYEELNLYVKEKQSVHKSVVIAAYSKGSAERIVNVCAEHGLKIKEAADGWGEALASKKNVSIVILGVQRGFETADLLVICEQDILGDRLARPRKKKLAENFIADASVLEEGDLVVHSEHGIGRYDGLVTLTINNAPHGCVRIIYGDDAKLFVPVENIEVLTRFGSEQTGVQLDKLGGVAWQARKAKLKKRIRDMAEQLIRIAAERHMKTSDKFDIPSGVYDEFCARFPFVETEDQQNSIKAVVDDLSEGKPMDRLVCGDVGFGKTEVALRAAFVTAMSGSQVAVVVPTTLLARQHYNNFVERFAGFPVKVAQLSRMVKAKEATTTKKMLAGGKVDIVIGTHALLAKTIKFADLGLLIIDEEQHFGVSHKERLKSIKSDVHVLTLTATPIPRTLQLALTGVRELSIIATPPVDRLAVRTFVLPFDPVVVKEAILREKHRGGQTYFVCPHVKDIDELADKLDEILPEIKYTVAHGRMAATQLEDVMTAFADGKYDVLIATNIIESGLDLPSVNTMIIHRSDMFGLAQLYQLRGRVGRSKVRGYAYLTVPPRKKLTKSADKRLNVMQTLDTLGAGFSLASHDMDIRGAGNLLGDEQSGHIKEVGIELYQHLLEEAVNAAKEGADIETVQQESWVPQISLGMPVLIPENYVVDLSIRMELYRRIASIASIEDLEELRIELIDRFGPIPDEVENLFEVVSLKALCREANIEKVDAGQKGVVFTLHNNEFPNPAGLIVFISKKAGTMKVRPDHKIVCTATWYKKKERMIGVRKIMESLANLAKEG